MDSLQIREMSKQLSVLYVEDEAGIREQTGIFLSKYFKQVDEAENGSVGLALFREKHYDLVISDLKMPQMCGEDMLQAIRDLDDKVVLVSMSGISGGDEKKKVDVDFTVSKPTTIDTLNKMIENVVIKSKERGML